MSATVQPSTNGFHAAAAAAAAATAGAATAAAAPAGVQRGQHTRQRSRSFAQQGTNNNSDRALAAAMEAMRFDDTQSGGGAAAAAAGGEGQQKRLHARKRSQSMTNETTPADAERIKCLEARNKMLDLKLFSATLEARNLGIENSKLREQIAELTATVIRRDKTIAELSAALGEILKHSDED